MSEPVDPRVKSFVAAADERTTLLREARTAVTPLEPPSLSPAEVAEFQRHHARAWNLLADAAWLDKLRATLVPFARDLVTAGAVAAGVPAPLASILTAAVSTVADAVVAEALSPGSPPPAPRA